MSAARTPSDPIDAGPTPAESVHADVVEDALDAAAAEAFVLTARTGASVLFRGVIRDHDSGREDVTALEYTGHPDAPAVMRAVVGRVAEAHPGVRVHAVHRLGLLGVGDDALVVAAGAAHRAEAFACCAAVVDAVKAEVPIWKRQEYAAGGHTWTGIEP